MSQAAHLPDQILYTLNHHEVEVSAAKDKEMVISASPSSGDSSQEDGPQRGTPPVELSDLSSAVVIKDKKKRKSQGGRSRDGCVNCRYKIHATSVFDISSMLI